ncbi:MAG: isocitrate/isopropylmalate family dehydrogenase, partial [Bryobacteraceae bacterium]
MSKYRIAWLPGDGIGPEVCDAARLVLDAAGFEADFIKGDIGWEFWKSEGDALPERTLDLLRSTDCAFFGAITSKPAAEAERELADELRGHGLTYRSPIIRMRQMLDLYICLRPCRAFHGNPLNYNDHIDLTVFRENTEGMYIGVE